RKPARRSVPDCAWPPRRQRHDGGGGQCPGEQRDMIDSVKQASGKLVGVGVGPGDPELLTIKAVRALKEADVVAHFAKNGNRSRARAVVEEYLSPDIAELELRYPVTTEIPKSAPAYCRTLHHFYDECAQTIARHLDEGRRVAVICEGDPFFY